MSAFVLSLLSPVLRATMCGNFRESSRKMIRLDDVGKESLLKLLWLACGAKELLAKDVDEMLELGTLADRLQMEAVRTQLENTLWQEVTADNCAEMIQQSGASGLKRLQMDCYSFMRDQFEIVVQKDSFLMLSEETVADLLEDDELGADREENVFEALVAWMRADEKRLPGEGLLRKIRYGVIDNAYLAGKMLSALSAESVLKELATESIVKKGAASKVRKVRKRAAAKARAWDGVERLCDKWMVARKMKGIILGNDVLRQPEYVAIDGQGQLVVSDSFHAQILIFNRDASIVRRIGSYGSALGQFKSPKGVAVNRQGNIVVADSHNHRIQVLNGDGSVERCFGSEGHAVGQLYYPCGVAIDNEDNIVVADYLNNRIQVFSSDGIFVRQFGSQNGGAVKLFLPKAVAVDGAGRIVVAEKGKDRVQVFNRDGSVGLCFGSEGDGPGQFREPCGVAVDRDGRIVVADTGNDRLQVFDSEGTFAGMIGAVGSCAGQVRSPLGVVIDGTGRIVVAEGGEPNGSNHRLQVLRAGVGPGVLAPWTVPSISWQPTVMGRRETVGLIRAGDGGRFSISRISLVPTAVSVFQRLSYAATRFFRHCFFCRGASNSR